MRLPLNLLCFFQRTTHHGDAMIKQMILGVLSHLLIFIHGELNNYAVQIFLAFSCSFAALLIVTGPYSAVLHCSAYLVGLVSSMVVYRLFFHRLRKYPGPLLMRITQLYSVYTA